MTLHAFRERMRYVGSALVLLRAADSVERRQRVDQLTLSDAREILHLPLAALDKLTPPAGEPSGS